MAMGLTAHIAEAKWLDVSRRLRLLFNRRPQEGPFRPIVQWPMRGIITVTQDDCETGQYARENDVRGNRPPDRSNTEAERRAETARTIHLWMDLPPILVTASVNSCSQRMEGRGEVMIYPLTTIWTVAPCVNRRRHSDIQIDVMNKKEMTMKTQKRLISSLLLLLAICACAGPSVPQGTQKIGHYKGAFSSMPLSGSCQFDLYRLPDGSGTFDGSFQGLEEDVFITLKGTMTGNHLEGTAYGEDVFQGSTVSGDLSADESEVSGTFSLNAPYKPTGTWNAKRK